MRQSKLKEKESEEEMSKIMEREVDSVVKKFKMNKTFVPDLVEIK